MGALEWIWFDILLKFLKKLILTKRALNPPKNFTSTSRQYSCDKDGGSKLEHAKLKVKAFSKVSTFWLFGCFFMVLGWTGVVGGAISGCGYEERRMWPHSFHHTHPKSRHNPLSLLSDRLGGSLKIRRHPPRGCGWGDWGAKIKTITRALFAKVSVSPFSCLYCPQKLTEFA